MSAPFGDRPCMHEALFDDRWLKETGLTTLDFAKAMIDEGYHPMTVYFPLVVHGAMLIEPTESESKASLDLFLMTLRDLALSALRGEKERFVAAPSSRAAPPPRRNPRRAPAGAALDQADAAASAADFKPSACRRAPLGAGGARPHTAVNCPIGGIGGAVHEDFSDGARRARARRRLCSYWRSPWLGSPAYAQSTPAPTHNAPRPRRRRRPARRLRRRPRPPPKPTPTPPSARQRRRDRPDRRARSHGPPPISRARPVATRFTARSWVRSRWCATNWTRRD